MDTHQNQWLLRITGCISDPWLSLEATNHCLDALKLHLNTENRWSLSSEDTAGRSQYDNWISIAKGVYRLKAFISPMKMLGNRLSDRKAPVRVILEERSMNRGRKAPNKLRKPKWTQEPWGNETRSFNVGMKQEAACSYMKLTEGSWPLQMQEPLVSPPLFPILFYMTWPNYSLRPESFPYDILVPLVFVWWLSWLTFWILGKRDGEHSKQHSARNNTEHAQKTTAPRPNVPLDSWNSSVTLASEPRLK